MLTYSAISSIDSDDRGRTKHRRTFNQHSKCLTGTFPTRWLRVWQRKEFGSAGSDAEVTKLIAIFQNRTYVTLENELEFAALNCRSLKSRLKFVFCSFESILLVRLVRLVEPITNERINKTKLFNEQTNVCLRPYYIRAQ